jgi:hypothetical protein
MEEKKCMRIHHLFNGDKKKKGPTLVIEVVFNPDGPDSGALIAHKWHGSGRALGSEFKKLKAHYKKNGFIMIHDYLEVAYPN